MRKMTLASLALLLLLSLNANAQENMKFDSEAKKLDFIRQMLSKEKNLRLADTNQPHCNDMMKDLLAGKGFKAIEPDVIADTEDEDDPRLEKWNHCGGDKEYYESKVDDPNFFHHLSQLGGPPYRFYRIELDGNPKNGPEDMIYHAMPKKPTSSTYTGYAWVDLANCEIKKGSFSVTGVRSKWLMKPHGVYLNTLVYYKSKLWVIDFVDGFDFQIFRWLDDRSGMEMCGWNLFEPEKKK